MLHTKSVLKKTAVAGKRRERRQKTRGTKIRRNLLKISDSVLYIGLIKAIVKCDQF